MDEESTDVFYEIESPQSQRKLYLNSRMKILLEASLYNEPDPNSDNHQTALRIDDDDDDDEEYNYLIDADLYSSAKQATGIAFLDALERVSNSKKMSVSSIFNSVSLSGDTLLHLAASYGNAEIVDLIITFFPTLLNQRNHIGDTTLHVASKAGYISVLRIINSKRKEFSNSYSSINCGLAGSVTWTDVSVKMRNKQGNTPLHEALINGHENVAVELVEEDEEASYFSNKEDKSAFYLAAEAGYKHCLQLMMKSRPIYLKGQQKSPIHAAIRGKHTDALEIMLEKQPRLIHSRDGEGRTPLHFVAWMGYNDGVDYLIRKSSRNVIERDNDGQLPIHLASINGHIDVIDRLLKHYSIVHELLNGKGRNILHVAAEWGKYDVVNYILKHPQELDQLINKKDNDGNTPLHLATMNSHPKIVSALTQDDRVDLQSTNNDNWTALDVAKNHMDEMHTFDQWLTWLSLKASGASLFNAVKQSKPCITEKLPSSVELQRLSINNAKQNLKDRVNTLLLVSTLIVTVTFQACYTLPGGNNDSAPNKGFATMIKHAMLQVFVLCDTIALFTSLVVAATLLFTQVEITITQTVLKFASPLLEFALFNMSLAFMSGVIVAVDNLKWLSNAILITVTLFLSVIALLLIPIFLPFKSGNRVFQYIITFFIFKVT